MGDMQHLDSGAVEGLESGVRRQGVVAGVRIWRYTAWQNGAIVSCPATVGLRLVSDNTDLSGAEIHRVTAKYRPENQDVLEGATLLD